MTPAVHLRITLEFDIPGHRSDVAQHRVRPEAVNRQIQSTRDRQQRLTWDMCGLPLQWIADRVDRQRGWDVLLFRGVCGRQHQAYCLAP